MAAEGEQRQPEIIIVRRHGYDDDEPHHGGVWKIAFADFMTAMMCFFLVMWLINASSEETRTALVSYFNPVKLIDRNTNRRGLEDLGYGPQSSVEEGGAADLESSGAQSPARYREAQDELIDPQVYSDERFFSEPYAVLAEISAQTGLRQNISEKGEGGEQNAGPSSGASGGDAYRDPFAPDFWTQQVADPQIGVDGNLADARKETVDELSEETGTSENRQSMPDDEVREAQAAPEHQRVADIVETAAELYFLPGVLKLGNGCECHVSWTGVPRIVLDLELRPKGVTVYFTLSLSADQAGIDVDYIAFDKPADDPELNSKLLRAALESARIHKTVAHCN